MPIYEYRCAACGHTLDALQKLSDEPLKDCPECEEPSLRRLVSAPAFRLKGGGWYETDFKSDKEKKRNLADDGQRKSAEDGKSKSADDGSKKSGDTAKSADASKAEKKEKQAKGTSGASSAVA
ncbi:MAG TPA: zinc ribbon domain-containing protein [Gammaproteobacteria bacterium]